jgi:sialic acid synthase SpsE
MLQLNPNHTFVIAEVGINHNGSMEMAKQLIDAAKDAGCDAVKFQKRTPAMNVPAHLWDQERDTPWGERMTYLAYRERIEFSSEQYVDLFKHASARGIEMFASPWDCNAADTLECMNMRLFKIASAKVTDLELIRHIAGFHKPVIMSTGMCTRRDIWYAMNILYPACPWIGLMVCTSDYPAKPEDLNLNRLYTFMHDFPDCPIGYSGHEPGLWTTLCAVAMGAAIVERHITLDRALPGTDQAASVEPGGFKTLVREIRNLQVARGSGEIRVLPCEAGSIKRLRG